jgi:uncharacterized protein (TIGR03435 family)
LTSGENRRAEIESDLWELHRDAAEHRGAALRVVLRLVIGMPDDVGWRIEQAVTAGAFTQKSIAFTARLVGAAFFVGTLWVIDVDASRPRPVSTPTHPAAAFDLQVASSGPTFEVASIKPNNSGDVIVRLIPQPGGRLTGTNVTAAHLLRFAYDLPWFQDVGGPGWVTSDRFDIAAKAEGDPPTDQKRVMLRRLLTERFKLSAHIERRNLPVYSLTTARKDRRLGAQLRRSTATCGGVEPANVGAFGPAPPEGPPSCGFFGFAPGTQFSAGRVGLAFRGLTMAELAKWLVPVLRRNVNDQTSLAGYFDADFDIVAEMPVPPPPPGMPNPFADAAPLSIFTVFPEQLGLKLESTTGPVDVLVIDGIERPTPD